MMNLAEYRRSTTRLADFLPWAALVDEGVVLNKDGSVPAHGAVPRTGSRLRGAGRTRRRRRRASTMRCAGSARAGRSSSRRSVIRPAAIPQSLSRCRLGAGRCRAQGRSSRRRELTSRSRYFLTFLYLPPPEDAARAERFLYEGRERGAAPMPARSCAASSTAPIACCSSSKASCPRAGGSMTRRR